MDILVSPSTRKVWIEIANTNVSMLGESCHLPHGRCGLKYALMLSLSDSTEVTFHTEGVD